MSKAVPSRPPLRPVRSSYSVTTATRVPGQRTRPERQAAESRPSED